MRVVICLLCLCFCVSGCAARKASVRGDKLVEAGDSWQTNKVIIRAAEKSGNLDVALVTASSEVSARPDNDEARVILARLLTRTGQPQQALITLESMGDGTKPEAALETARAELALGNAEKVNALLDQAESGSPSRALARETKKLRAVAFDLVGDHAAAQAAYRSLLGEHDEMGVRYNYGRSLIASQDYGKAVSMLLPLVEMYEFPQARVAAAAAMAKNKDVKGARNLLHGYMPEAEITRILDEGSEVQPEKAAQAEKETKPEKEAKAEKGGKTEKAGKV